MVELIETRLRAGVWQALLRAAVAPEVEVRHDGAALAGLTVEKAGDLWRVRVAIPATMLNEGAEAFLLLDSRTGARLGQFTILAGDLAPDHLIAEVAQLRAELELLKEAVRLQSRAG